MRFFLNLVYFLVKLCQNILSDLEIRGGFTQFILRSHLLADSNSVFEISTYLLFSKSTFHYLSKNLSTKPIILSNTFGTIFFLSNSFGFTFKVCAISFARGFLSS